MWFRQLMFVTEGGERDGPQNYSLREEYGVDVPDDLRQTSMGWPPSAIKHCFHYLAGRPLAWIHSDACEPAELSNYLVMGNFCSGPPRSSEHVLTASAASSAAGYA
jgi:hypothetical protein